MKKEGFLLLRGPVPEFKMATATWVRDLQGSRAESQNYELRQQDPDQEGTSRQW